MPPPFYLLPLTPLALTSTSTLDGQRITRSTLRSLEAGDVEGVLRSICRPHAASRSCIQEAGEIMYVPHRWGHEIFNLEPSVGVQAMHTPAWRGATSSRVGRAAPGAQPEVKLEL